MTFSKALIALHKALASSIPNMTVLQVPSDMIACVQGHLTHKSTDQQGKRKKGNEKDEGPVVYALATGKSRCKEHQRGQKEQESIMCFR